MPKLTLHTCTAELHTCVAMLHAGAGTGHGAWHVRRHVAEIRAKLHRRNSHMPSKARAPEVVIRRVQPCSKCWIFMTKSDQEVQGLKDWLAAVVMGTGKGVHGCVSKRDVCRLALRSWMQMGSCDGYGVTIDTRGCHQEHCTIASSICFPSAQLQTNNKGQPPRTCCTACSCTTPQGASHQPCAADTCLRASHSSMHSVCAVSKLPKSYAAGSC